MKSILLLFATVTLGFATPIAERATVPELATFDDLTPDPVPALNTVPVPYRNLNFSSFNFQSAGTAGVAAGVFPESGANYAANGPLSPTRTPMFTVQGVKSVVSFDLHYFYYGCLVPTETQNAQAATACTFTVTGVKASNGAIVGPTSFKFLPNNLTNATMEEATFGSGYSGLKTAIMAVTSSPVTSEVAVLVVDSVNYTIHTK